MKEIVSFMFQIRFCKYVCTSVFLVALMHQPVLAELESSTGSEIKVVSFGQKNPTGSAVSSGEVRNANSLWPASSNAILPARPRRVIAPVRPTPPSGRRSATNNSPVTTATQSSNSQNTISTAEGSAEEVPSLQQSALSVPKPESLSPEAIQPVELNSNQVEAVSNQENSTPEEAGQFISRRESLGEPTSRLNKLESADKSNQTEIRPSGTAGWYKIAASALFLASLGMIGFRYKHNKRTLDDEMPATWAPPIEPSAKRHQHILQQKRFSRDDAEDFSEAYNKNEFEEEAIVRETGKKKRRRSPILNKAASEGTFVFETGPTGHDPGFHDEVERRIQRLSALQNAASMGEELERRRRPSPKSNEYSMIEELAEAGASADEIAKRFSMPIEEVETLLNLR
ncbi:MAG: hypothetical protein AUJ18_10060 [Candidatus Hydrogenedentes bacterium CG1_02_42_14]|nr:MAG: hypothetical protein AUJ18_10060 [Candidatus Hydrogenedentes bacterium CG1_02_42_14]